MTKASPKKLNVRASGITMSVYVDSELLATRMPRGWIDAEVPEKYKNARLAVRKAIRELPPNTYPEGLAEKTREILQKQSRRRSSNRGSSAG